MLVVDREMVQRLMRSPDPDAALVFRRGSCVIAPAGTADTPEGGMLIARRRDIAEAASGGDITDEQLDAIAHRLDNAVRDLGG